jgi:hypothetical protein
MATFPSLTPSAAPITPGAWPVTATSSLNGAESRIRHGSAEIGRRLRLTFTNVTEADFLAILAHYRGQRSGFDSFGFSTTTLAADLTPAGHAWLYASRPQVVDEHFDVFTVVCEFKAEPRGLVVAPGKAWRTGAATFTPGARSGGVVYATGVAWATISTTFAPGGRSGAADPSYSSIGLLLQFGGANDSTTFTDSGPLALSGTTFGNAKISTSGGVFSNGNCGVFDGDGDYVLYPAASVPRFTGNFTIETWAYPTAINSRSIASSGHSSDNNVQLFRMESDGSVTIYMNANGVDTGTITTAPAGSVVANQWQHMALCRSESGTRLFVGGVQVGATNTSWTGAFTCNVIGQHFFNGAPWFSPGQFQGKLSDFRTTSAARYTASFTPPAAPFPNA